jgi:hypothetical protein
MFVNLSVQDSTSDATHNNPKATMKLLTFLVNPDVENPTAGIRGVIALVLAGSGPFWLDWRSMAMPLGVVVFVGLLVGLSLLADAARGLRK